MVVNCEDVWREISNYLEGDVEPDLRLELEEHIRGCKRCSAVLEGTRNVIQLYGDERMLEVPLGFSRRLQHRLEESMPRSRRSFLGWVVAGAAASVLAGVIGVARASIFGRTALRSQLAQSGKRIPPEMEVVVSTDGKIFHRQGCPFIHDKAHVATMTASEAVRAGYTPCVRCMKQYLSSA
jgi:anti-sigma factor RsiW